MKKHKQKMNRKNLFSFFLAIACVLLLSASFVSADEIADLTDYTVEVNGVVVAGTNSVSNMEVTAGQTVTLRVEFTAVQNDTNVRIEAELDGDKVTKETVSEIFDVEADGVYVKTMTLEVPYELKDTASGTIKLNVVVDGKTHQSDLARNLELKLQRPSYNANVLSINTPSTNTAGDSMAIDVVIKNIGYNNLDDLYLTAKIPELGVEKTVYAGDLQRLENEFNDEDEDTISTRIYLSIPYGAEEGLYTLEVGIGNNDFVAGVTKQIFISNEFANNLIANTFRKIFSVGDTAEYELLIVNPTDNIKVYKIVTDASNSLTLGLSNNLVAVQPDSSKAVTLSVSAENAGDYSFDVTVLSGEELVGQATLNATVEGGVSANDAIVVLTIVLAIIFLVLLAVLIVLLRKRPEKSDEFGESYY